MMSANPLVVILGAALFMTLFRSLIRAASTTDQFSGGNSANKLSPAARLQQVMSFTNQYIAETHAEANMFATVFIGIINLQNGTLTYMNCGNESPLILRNGVVLDSLRPTGPVIGVFAEAVLKVEATAMEANDLLLAFTDGVPDAIDPDGTIFGHDRFQALLESSQATPSSLLKNIMQGLSDFAGPADQFDDITMLALRWLDAARIPVAVTPKAKGLVPEDHPLFLATCSGMAGDRLFSKLVQEADLLIGIGFYTFQEALFGFLLGCGLGVLHARMAVLRACAPVIVFGWRAGATLLIQYPGATTNGSSNARARTR